MIDLKSIVNEAVRQRENTPRLFDSLGKDVPQICDFLFAMTSSEEILFSHASAKNDLRDVKITALSGSTLSLKRDTPEGDFTVDIDGNAEHFSFIAQPEDQERFVKTFLTWAVYNTPEQSLDVLARTAENAQSYIIEGEDEAASDPAGAVRPMQWNTPEYK